MCVLIVMLKGTTLQSVVSTCNMMMIMLSVRRKLIVAINWASPSVV